MFQKLIWCCTCCNGYSRMFQVFNMFLDICCRYFICMFQKSWFTCRRLRPADASTTCIQKQGRWAQGTVPPCGRGMGARAQFCRAGRGMDAYRGSGLWRWLGMGRSAWDAMRAWGAGVASGRVPGARRPGASLNHKLILFLIKATSIIYWWEYLFIWKNLEFKRQ
jgi:hypothetical protein